MLREVRARRDDEGSIVVLAAVLVPVIVLVIAVALSTMVWGASETELQRASDRAATEAAASALLVDFPQSQVTTLNENLYPKLSSVLPFTPAHQPTLSACQTLGNPIAAASSLLNPGGFLGSLLSPLVGKVSDLTSAVAALPQPIAGALAGLPSGCAGLGAVSPIPAAPVGTEHDACAVAAASVAAGTAPFATRFFQGDAASVQPTCDNGRVRLLFSTQSPLLGFGSTSASVGDALQLSVPQGLSTVQNALVPLGVRLDTTLPNTLCPQVSVEVDQPVRGPMPGPTTTTGGRSTARRVMKNAVVVPVFNGLHLASATSTAVLTSNGLGSVSFNGSTNTNVTIPAANLNSTLLQPLQQKLLGAMDTLDTRMNSALQQANAGVSQLAGTVNSVGATTTGLPTPLPPVAGNVGQLDLLKCVRQIVSELYDPPTGDAPTVDDVLASAAAAGEPVQVIQVGVQSCAPPVPPPASPVTAVSALSCVQAATGSAAASALNEATGLYDVPFFDVTPAMVRSVGNGNYEAVPVAASQADGAFRASLVRSTTDTRYAP